MGLDGEYCLDLKLDLPVHECIHTHRVWPASCVFKLYDPCAPNARLEITAVCPSPPLLSLNLS